MIACLSATPMICSNSLICGKVSGHRVCKKHVKGHSGHALNTLADSAAKAALNFQHDRTLYRTASFSKVFLTLQHHGIPHFTSWF